MQTYYCYTDSPLGQLLLAGNFNGLSYVGFQDGPEPVFPERDWRRDAAFFVNAILQFKEFFRGERKQFCLRLNPAGSDFQLKVLEAVTRVPYGTTASYTDIARLVKNPRAVRAVGSANRKNPLPIVIPCHRIIGRDGSLTGYNGGLERKEWLLKLEADSLGESWGTPKGMSSGRAAAATAKRGTAGRDSAALDTIADQESMVDSETMVDPKTMELEEAAL